MSAVISVVTTVLWGLVVLSLLVFVHEGGHFLAARACGVRVTEFFLGMPSRLRLSHRSRRIGTEVGVTPILLGGYTRICGMEGRQDDLLADALWEVTRSGRLSVSELATRLGCDEGRAYALLATLADWASVEPYYNPELGESPSQADWPAAFQTPRRDARLLTAFDRGHDFSLEGSTEAGEAPALDLTKEGLFAQERSRTYVGSGFGKRALMLVCGPLVNVALAFLIVVGTLMIGGVEYVANTSTLGGVAEGSYAEAAGLAAGDTIMRIDDTEVSTWEELTSALSAHTGQGQDFEVTFERDGQVMSTLVDLPDGQAVELVGIYASVVTYHATLAEATRVAVDYVGQVATSIAQLLQPSHTMEVLDQSSSVIGISVMTAEAAQSGLTDLLYLVAAVSLSLGLMNLLPIPPLDGGKLLIEVIQLLIRRPLSARAQACLTYAGLAIFLVIFVVVVRNDIVRYVIG